jgi:hypothetical protein
MGGVAARGHGVGFSNVERINIKGESDNKGRPEYEWTGLFSYHLPRPWRTVLTGNPTLVEQLTPTPNN